MAEGLEDKKRRLIVGASIGECIHVAGVLNFFQVAESVGYKTKFLGPAVKIDEILDFAEKHNAGIVAISYRLTPAIGRKHLEGFAKAVLEGGRRPRRYLLGCLPELADDARKMELFDAVFTGGETIDEVLPVLGVDEHKGGGSEDVPRYPGDLIGRVAYKQPYPVLRAHFGLPSMQETLDGVAALAEASILDVISLAPDQAAQEWLQHPDVLASKSGGAGGVPIRSRADLEAIYRRSQRGNHPLLRIYSGTQDLVKNGELFSETIHNAWAAIPVFWYSELDGRGPSVLVDAISEHFDAIRWHAAKGIPVEINDPHQWGLRMAPDHIVVTDAYLVARVARTIGVKTFIQQLMFNTPAGCSFKMDLARILAMIEIVQPLVDETFTILKETRAGLGYFSPREEAAMGQLCASTMMQMSVRPHIMHVVSYCEGDHAARPQDVIKSCKIIGRVIQDSLHGLPDMAADPIVRARKNDLLAEATTLLAGIAAHAKARGISDPYANPEFHASLVESGILDAPHLKGGKAGRGEIMVKIVDGACKSVDASGTPMKEIDRLKALGVDTGGIDTPSARELLAFKV
ncbi:MAG: methionine synthase [Candidatus Lokiarchaeota archaeon]|nr:methionine synthase [Candidatus Lokiarchaeota archaeon]